MSERYEERIHIKGIDLSKAFDCLDRETLMKILEDIGITEDELRMIVIVIVIAIVQVQVNCVRSVQDRLILIARLVLLVRVILSLRL